MEQPVKKKVIRKKKAPKKHIVVFQDHEEKVLKSVFVQEGDPAEAPAMKEVLLVKEHHKVVFQGWDQDISHVHANLVVRPIYQEIPKEYLIMYFNENGKILGTETVPYGEDAKMPFYPEKDETAEFRYHFEGWNCELTQIDGDRMAKARFRQERKQFPVHFLDDTGRVIKEEMVYYGQSAHAPDHVTKEADMTFRYHFKGWDREFSSITSALVVASVFEPEYIEYQIRFFEEGKEIEQGLYHYQDVIAYPMMWKKGYDFIWEKEDKIVSGSLDIPGHWEYSNPKGKIIENELGVFEIMDPSIVNGGINCLEYHSEEAIITIPDRILLGDYYYNLERIGSKAFRSCPNVKKIICPDSVKTLEDKAFADNPHLEEIVFGKKISDLKIAVFANSEHLRKITFRGEKKIRIHRNTFEKCNRRLHITLPASACKQYEKILQKDIREKQFIIER